MVRKCSQCGSKGHNTRTCTALIITNNKGASGSGSGSGLRLFGVELQLGTSCSSIKKSYSMDCLSANNSSSISSSTPTPSSSNTCNSLPLPSVDENNLDKLIISNGYISDHALMDQGAQDRKKGLPWTEEEHSIFLQGLEKLGKGDWRGISRNFVTTRTPTQVASHAQKYFLRLNTINNNNNNHKKRRPSLFDVGKRDDQSVNKTPAVKTNEPFFPSKLVHQTTPSSSITGFKLLDEGSHQSRPTVWLQGSFHSHPKFQSSLTQETSFQNSTLPDLELTLAAKRPLDQSNNKPTPHIVERPISVV